MDAIMICVNPEYTTTQVQYHEFRKNPRYTSGRSTEFIESTLHTPIKPDPSLTNIEHGIRDMELN